ncbi:MAG: M28 family peptidase [Candidatus Geothermincolia bacterium]
MELPSKHALYLSKRIGSRGAGSDGEAAAASYVLRVFRDADLDVEMETFSGWKSDTQGLIVIYLIAIAAYLLFRLSYPVGLAVSILVFLVFQVETYTWAVISRLMPHSSASNVVGRARSRGKARERVIIVANYDTAKSSPLGGRRLARAYRLLYVLSFACIIIIMLVGFFGVGASLTKVSKETVSNIWLFTSPFAVYLLFLAVLMMFGESRGRYTAGANDNASGLGAMLSVMERVSEKPPEHTEVWGVATGRGCAGARGMIAFLHRHRHTLRDAYFVNLDHCGVGDTKIVTREGAMFGFRCSRRLKRMTLAAATRSTKIEVKKGKCRVKKSDGMAAIVRGYRAITIGGLDGGTFPGWRNKDDTLDGLERESLDRTVKLVRCLIDEIDRPDAKKRQERKRRPRPRRHDEGEPEDGRDDEQELQED